MLRVAVCSEKGFIWEIFLTTSDSFTPQKISISTSSLTILFHNSIAHYPFLSGILHWSIWFLQTFVITDSWDRCYHCHWIQGTSWSHRVCCGSEPWTSGLPQGFSFHVLHTNHLCPVCYPTFCVLLSLGVVFLYLSLQILKTQMSKKIFGHPSFHFQ